MNKFFLIFLIFLTNYFLFAQEIALPQDYKDEKILLETINRTSSTNTEKISAYKQLGNIALSSKEYEKAIYFFSKLKKDPDAYSNLCKIYSLKKDYKKTFLYHEKYLKLFYTDEKNIKNAEEYITDLLELSFLCDKLGKDKKSLKILKKLTTKYSDNKKIKFYLALKFYSLNKFDEAISNMKSLVNPDNNDGIYPYFLTEISDIKTIYEKNIKMLSPNNISLENTDIFYRLADYCDTLRTACISTRIKISVHTSDINAKFIIDLTYSENKSGIIKISLSNKLPVGTFPIVNNKIYIDENLSKFLNIDDKLNILEQLFGIFDLNSSQIIFQEKIKKEIFFNLKDNKISVDANGNLKYIETPSVKIDFKNFNNFILPSKISTKNSEFLNLNFLDFKYTFSKKESFDKEVDEINESKSKC